MLLGAVGAGVAVVDTGLGGMAELVQEGVHGWSFPVGDAGALAGVLSQRLRAGKDFTRVGPTGSPSFPTWEEATDQILEHYGACLASVGSQG